MRARKIHSLYFIHFKAVTSRLDSGHPDQNDPENTLSADQADSISTSSFVERITDNMNAFIYEVIDFSHEKKCLKCYQKLLFARNVTKNYYLILTDTLHHIKKSNVLYQIVFSQIEESNNCRINKHEFLNVIAKRFLPGYEVVKKKPSLNSSSTLVQF